jgi:5'/3'-nucleotidase SurE
MPPVPRRLLIALPVWLVLACATLSAPVEPAAVPSLHILLTNDDGLGAPGIRAMHEALAAAGHRVSVVAPSGNRSGIGVALTMEGTLTYRELSPGVVSVDGTPADCVRLALKVLLDEPVDLVVSGVNFGQNVGDSTASSGTVGAAVTASGLGVPAVAVSQAVDARDVRATARFFPDAAATGADLVGVLARGERPLLPPWTALNLNYPARNRAEVAGVRLTRQGRGRLYDLRYEPVAAGTLRVSFARDTAEDPVRDADSTALAAGFVTITALDGSWTAPKATRSRLHDLPGRLEAAREAALSAP